MIPVLPSGCMTCQDIASLVVSRRHTQPLVPSTPPLISLRSTSMRGLLRVAFKPDSHHTASEQAPSTLSSSAATEEALRATAPAALLQVCGALERGAAAAASNGNSIGKQGGGGARAKRLKPALDCALEVLTWLENSSPALSASVSPSAAVVSNELRERLAAAARATASGSMAQSLRTACRKVLAAIGAEGEDDDVGDGDDDSTDRAAASAAATAPVTKTVASRGKPTNGKKRKGAAAAAGGAPSASPAENSAGGGSAAKKKRKNPKKMKQKPA